MNNMIVTGEAGKASGAVANKGERAEMFAELS